MFSEIHLGFGGLLSIHGKLFAHSGQNNDICQFVTMSVRAEQARLTRFLVFLGEELGDLISSLALREFDIVFGVASIVHQRKEAVLGDVKLDFAISSCIA
jgi:hypothetical protein